MRPRAKTIASLALAALALGLAASWLVGSAMVAGSASFVQPAHAPAVDFRLPSRGGVILGATYRPGAQADSPAVLLLHGVRASRNATAPNAEWLASLGYGVLTVDFRGHGQSTLTPRSFGLAEAEDAEAAFRWLKRRQHGAKVAVIGISLGGAASLLGRAGPVPADALILQAVYPDIRHAIRNRIAARLTSAPAWMLEPLLSYQAPFRFGVWPSALAPIAALPRYRGPVLVIGGTQDRSTPPEESRAMFAAAAGPKSLWLIPEGDHDAISDARDRAYRARVRAFLERWIGSGSARHSQADERQSGE
jgi:pimeloyl-ACP methyl ester carboxylesterase